jgi:hypothetical protein
MSFEKSYYQVGSMRIRKSSLKRALYISIAVLVAVMFMSSLVYMILFGQSPY